MKTAIVFGVTGQTGSYLAEFLLQQGYGVLGVCRRASVDTTQRLKRALTYHDMRLIEGDVTDESSVNHVISLHSEADEVYNLAAQSHVHTSFEQPHYTWQTDAVGVMNILEAIRRWAPSARFYQASTSEMFGNNYSFSYTSHGQKVRYQDENTAFAPTSPYAIAKVAGHYLTKMYRTAYHIFTCSGILFNHESERRGDMFVTRKITRYVGWLANQNQIDMSDSRQLLHLGNLNASRDWGHAEDYARAIWLMLQQPDPDDYVIATGRSHTVADFCNVAFNNIGITDWKRFVVVDEKFFRPSDVEYLSGHAQKAQENLGWKLIIDFNELVRRMVSSDIKLMEGQDCPTLL
jgi:GDPmannose 4,6-dehydratase